MKKEIPIPDGVNVEIENKKVKVIGPKGQLEKEFKYFFDIKMSNDKNSFIVESKTDKKKEKAVVGTVVAHVKNLIRGVTDGFTYKMKVVYTHFPITAKVEGNKIVISNFLGEKTNRYADILGNTKIEIKGQDIILTGTSKEDVAQTAANIETATKISKKDRRVFMDGIYITKGR